MKLYIILLAAALVAAAVIGYFWNETAGLVIGLAALVLFVLVRFGVFGMKGAE